MSFRILLVDSDPTTVAITESALVEAGHRVAWVSTFEEATRQLSLDYPDLLVTSVRLGAFNGMHLIFRFRAEHPDVPAIVIDALADLTPDMRRVVLEQRLGFVATVTPDGRPNLSPKGTTTVWDDRHLPVAPLATPTACAGGPESVPSCRPPSIGTSLVSWSSATAASGWKWLRRRPTGLCHSRLSFPRSDCR